MFSCALFCGITFRGIDHHWQHYPGLNEQTYRPARFSPTGETRRKGLSYTFRLSAGEPVVRAPTAWLNGVGFRGGAIIPSLRNWHHKTRITHTHDHQLCFVDSFSGPRVAICSAVRLALRGNRYLTPTPFDQAVFLPTLFLLLSMESSF